MPVGLDKLIRRFGAAHSGRIFLAAVKRSGEVFEAFAAQHFVREQRNPFYRDGREVALDLMEDSALRRMPFLEEGIVTSAGSTRFTITPSTVNPCSEK